MTSELHIKGKSGGLKKEEEDGLKVVTLLHLIPASDPQSSFNPAIKTFHFSNFDDTRASGFFFFKA